MQHIVASAEYGKLSKLYEFSTKYSNLLKSMLFIFWRPISNVDQLNSQLFAIIYS